MHSSIKLEYLYAFFFTSLAMQSPLHTHTLTYFVTLNILSSLRALRTDSPNDPDFRLCQITSKIDPLITTQSKRLKADSKYIRGPNAYILMNISIINSPKKPHSAYSANKNNNKNHTHIKCIKEDIYSIYS